MSKSSSLLNKIQDSLPSPKYRADIDGLRGIAVLAVLGFHAFPGRVPGGFIGVDVFFVISGFLISSIIFKNLEDGCFSYSAFYSRRINRIFPALLLVLGACGVFGWFALFPEEYAQLGKHISGGAGFVSNFMLWSENGYFDTISEGKPLLHLWSLAIEEQFYIIWPLLLGFVWKRRWNFLWVTIAIAVVSFGLNAYLAQKDPTAAFYSPVARFWELMAGGVLAYINLHRPDLNKKFKNAQSILGFALLAIGFSLINKKEAFPGWWAMLPAAAAFFIISAGPKAFLNRHLLSAKYLVFVGLISYPLYLWHWPMLSYATLVSAGIPSLHVRVALLLGAVVLSLLTFLFVEKPIRFGNWYRRSSFLLFVAMVFIGTVGYACFMSGGVSSRYPQSAKMHPRYHSSPRYIADYYAQDGYRDIFRNAPPVKERDFFLSNSKQSRANEIAIVGDSHAHKLYLGLIGSTKRATLHIGRGGCPPLIDTEVEDKADGLHSCQPFVNNYLSHLRDDRSIRVIVLNAFYERYRSQGSLRFRGQKTDGTVEIARTVDYLAKSGKVIVLAQDVPEIQKLCYSRKLPVWSVENTEKKECVMDRAAYYKRSVSIEQAVSALQRKHKSVLLYDPGRLFCNSQYCGEIDSAKYLFGGDGNHLNSYGSDLVGRDLALYLENILR